MTNRWAAPQGLEKDGLNDMMWDLMDNGATTLQPTEDPEKWIFWLKRYAGFFEVTIRSHTPTALILEGY